MVNVVLNAVHVLWVMGGKSIRGGQMIDRLIKTWQSRWFAEFFKFKYILFSERTESFFQISEFSAWKLNIVSIHSTVDLLALGGVFLFLLFVQQTEPNHNRFNIIILFFFLLLNRRNIQTIIRRLDFHSLNNRKRATNGDENWAVKLTLEWLPLFLASIN